VLLLQVTKFPFFIVVIVFGFTFQVINSQVSNEDVDMHINMREREREREYVVLQELLSAIVLHLFLYLQCKKHNKVSGNHKNCVLYYGIH
jgi:hypothetical protein